MSDEGSECGRNSLGTTLCDRVPATRTPMVIAMVIIVLVSVIDSNSNGNGNGNSNGNLTQKVLSTLFRAYVFSGVDGGIKVK